MAKRAPALVQLRFLGGAEVAMGGQRITPDSDRVFALLVRLSAPVGRRVARDVVLELLWPGVPAGSARHNLRQVVYKAREQGIRVEADLEELWLDPAHVRADWDDPTVEVTGGWLDSYAPAFSAPMRAWVATQRLTVHAQLRPRLLRALQTARTAGDLREAVRVADQLLRIDPLNEEATFVRAEQLALEGSKADALRLLDTYMAEVGAIGGADAVLPAKLLRSRIAERLPRLRYAATAPWHGVLVGRDVELATLLRLVFDTRAGRGSSLVISGPRGMGTSRLAAEATKSAALQGMAVLELQCPAPDAEGPLSVLPLLLAGLLRLPGAAGVSPAVLASLTAISALSARAAVGTVPDREALADLLAAVSEERPLLLVLDGAESLEPALLSLLVAVHGPGATRAFATLLVSAEDAQSLAEAHGLPAVPAELAVGPLAPADVVRMLRSYAGETMSAAALAHVEEAAALSEGNPMYAQEFLGALSDEVRVGVVPIRVRTEVARRVAALTATQRAVVAAAVALGGCATDARVAAVVGRRVRQVELDCGVLVRRRVVRYVEDRIEVSPLVGEAVVAELDQGQRDVVGKAVVRVTSASWRKSPDLLVFCSHVRALLNLGHDTTAEQFIDANCAVLLRLAPLREAAAALASLASATSNPKIASLLSNAAKATAAWNSLTPEPPVAESARLPKSLFRMSGSHHALNWRLLDRGQIAKVLADARDLTLPTHQRLSCACTALAYAYHFPDSPEYAEAWTLVQRLRLSRDARPFDVHRADVINSFRNGKSTEALAASRRLVESARETQDHAAILLALRHAVTVLRCTGRIDEALTLALEAIDLSRSTGRLLDEASSLSSLGLLSLLNDDLDYCIEECARASQVASEIGEDAATLTLTCEGQRAIALALKGQQAEAEAVYQALVNRFSTARTSQHEALALLMCAQAVCSPVTAEKAFAVDWLTKNVTVSTLENMGLLAHACIAHHARLNEPDRAPRYEAPRGHLIPKLLARLTTRPASRRRARGSATSTKHSR